MNFSDLYINNKRDVENKIATLWGGEVYGDAQKAQFEKLKAKIGEIFAPEDAVPVVQCMNSYKSVHSVPVDEAKALVGSLWTSKYDPYEHQYDSWNTLLKEKYEDKPMSICVTTGTGSGKTECFMMPLVYDLAKNYQQGQIQAIFLYPLNALMEDQKERLEKMLENIEQSTGVHLTYTVYNGDLPDQEFADDNQSDEAIRTRRKIAQIRGEYKDSETGEIKYKFPRMVYTRKAIRKAGQAPNILLTNPTMLEYILLRKSDEKLIDPKKQSLRWIAIDETHTYTGAGAAELAMLLRRVMIAFDMDAKDIRFATSSATFANGDTEEQKAKAEHDLKKFISDLTGTSLNQVRVIDGVREGEEQLGQDCPLPEEDKILWKKLCHDDFVELDKLFPEGTIAEKLRKLDEMCQRVEELQQSPEDKLLMKCKVHYFYRVPNNGFYVRLNEHQEGAFEVYTQKPIDQDNQKLPLLELTRCKHCGEFLAVGMLEKPEGTLYSLENNDSDMFDLGTDEDDTSELKQTVFALSNKPITDFSHTGCYDIDDNNKIVPTRVSSYSPTVWHLIGNEYHECPCCKKKLTRTESKKKDSDAEDNSEDMRLQKMRLSAEFISRILAPTTLDQLDESTSKNSITLHKGQQYISFVDSRQAAAKSTMNQNLEQERLWFYTTIYRKLCRLGSEKELLKKELEELNRQYDSASDRDTKRNIDRKIQEIEDKLGKSYLDWDEIAEDLYKDDKFMVFCHQFIKRTEDSEDLNPDGSIKEEAKRKYLYSIMVLYLGNRPATAASHETMGLFRPCYPFLSNIKIPQSVETFNQEIQNEDNKIKPKDWQDLIQVFIDYTVRSNQSVFLSMQGAGNKHMYDIFSCERYATEKPRRRPVSKPKYEKKGDTSDSRIVRYLSGLITRDHGITDDNETQKKFFDIIKPVVDDLWQTLESNKILEIGTHYDEDKDKSKQVEDNDKTALRFNLAKMALTLYDDVYLCDTNTDGGENHVPKRRPIQVNFKSFSPYLIGNRAVALQEEFHQQWDCYDGYNDNVAYDINSVKEWAKEKRSILWDNNLWGEDGVFSDRLENIHLTPNLFIQGEHTAQVDKMVARKLQEDFKDHSINILACSTTMEMGVDLGNLEVVMLTSVPPLPANYKQRAGRSGRNNKVKSVCVTLCGSDAIGLRTLHNPLETIIMRPVDVPTVDLMSQQVVKRHVIAYLIRTFGVFAAGENGGSLNQIVLDFYTPFRTVRSRGDYTRYYNDTHEISPEDGMGDPANTNYMKFDERCGQSISQEMRIDLEKLLKDTPYVNSYDGVLKEAKKENKRCYEELCSKVEDIRQAVKNADPNSKGYGSYMNLLKMEYMEILTQKLLNYWATNRFTPNANMPVNIMSLDLNATKLKNRNDVRRGVSNPNYTLCQAIQQYVPGNSIVVDGVVYIVRGLTTQDAYNSGRTIKKLYRNANKTVVGEDVTLDSPIPWTVNEQIGVNLVQPVRFLPDPNEDYSRVMDDNVYTHVSAQLIGTKDWGNKITEPNLFSTRRSDETGNANILYYNEGIGYGYAMCLSCGKMCIETGPVEEGKEPIPRDIDDKQNDKGRYHFSIDREKKHYCFGSGRKDYIKRNVIIGDLMQTDYCEIRIRHEGDTSWMSFSTNKDTDNENTNLLITLGIVFTQALVELKGWEKGSVDFAVMQNRHLCIFDTNPGGSGYSIKLNDNQTMLDVIEASKKLLLKAKEADAKDMLLDKFTLRFIRHIDIDAALRWIDEQERTKGVFPDPIPEVFNKADVRMSSIQELLNAFAASSTPSTIFVDDEYDKWNYGTPEYGWQSRLLGEFFNRRNNTTFCVAGKNNAIIPEGALQMLRSIEAIFENPVKVEFVADKAIYPLAYIDGKMYFTINSDSSTLNECWGDGVLYCINIDNPAKDAKKIDCTVNKETTQLFFLNDNTCEEIGSKGLGKIIHTHDEKAKIIIDRFIDHCKSTNGNLYISYQDEHMKSLASFVLTLQTIEYFVNQIGKDFKLEFLLEEYEYNIQKRGIFANIQDSDKRDDKLVDTINYWWDKSKIKPDVEEIDSKPAGSLTHWRVLTFEYKGKRLSIYPDGGLLNGWKLGKLNGKYFDYYNTTTDDDIPLQRQSDIKYEVHIEDI